jgi:hypothetical protein
MGLEELVLDAAADAAKQFNITLDGFREALILRCAEFDMPDMVAKEINQIAPLNTPAPAAHAAPAAHVVPPPPPGHHAEFQKLSRLRTQQSHERGERLADAALRMDGWFHWAKSGPNQPGYGGVFLKDEAAFKAKGTDFTRWLTRNAAEPGANSTMNCWEAVLFSAYRARLVDAEWLRALHNNASEAYRQHYNQLVDGVEDVEHYFRTIVEGLGFNNSVLYIPDAGLFPRRGDILFLGEDHVAVSLGRSWNENLSHLGHSAMDHMMSLWKHNGGKFAHLCIADIYEGWSTNKPRFAPCPF